MDISNTLKEKAIAVLIPCYNEAITIANVIESFRKELPHSMIYVFDNNSTDKTAEIAHEYGATVIRETKQGKGNVVRAMFQKIQAEIYILVDGDATYPAHTVKDMIMPVASREVDMVVGNRMAKGVYHVENKRPFHSLGNRLVIWLVNTIFKSELSDIMSGYRVFSKRFVKTIPLLSPGFEVETEITLHALDKKLKIREIDIDYRDRPQDSHSKLSTFSDGFKVLKTIFFVFKNYKPFAFFSLLSALLAIAGFAIGLPPIIEYFQYQYVYKVPSAVLAASLEVLAVLLFTCGLILDTVARQHKEIFEIHYKNQS